MDPRTGILGMLCLATGLSVASAPAEEQAEVKALLERMAEAVRVPVVDAVLGAAEEDAKRTERGFAMRVDEQVMGQACCSIPRSTVRTSERRGMNRGVAEARR